MSDKYYRYVGETDGHLYEGVFELVSMPEEKTMKKQDDETVWEFDVSSDTLIDVEEIQETLTRNHPVAIVTNGQGGCFIIIHDSIWVKAEYVKRELKQDLYTALIPFDSFSMDERVWAQVDRGVLSPILAAVKAIRTAQVKRKYRNPMTITVKMIEM